MPVFTLKKYEEKIERSVPPSLDSRGKRVDTKNAEEGEEEVTIQVDVSDTISGIVAKALLKAMPNLALNEETPKGPTPDSKDKPETSIISTEDINASPVDTLSRVRGSSSVVVVNKGFTTPQEEWFLTSLVTLGTKVYYSVESYVNATRLVGKRDAG